MKVGAGKIDLVPPYEIHAEESGDERTVAIIVRAEKAGGFLQGRYDPATNKYWQGYGPKQTSLIFALEIALFTIQANGLFRARSQTEYLRLLSTIEINGDFCGDYSGNEKPRIAVFSGPTATIQNTEPLVTSNKAREKYGLPLAQP